MTVAWLHRLSWLLWAAGTIVIALSWAGKVSSNAGWIGFAVAAAGSLLSLLPRRRS